MKGMMNVATLQHTERSGLMEAHHMAEVGSICIEPVRRFGFLAGGVDVETRLASRGAQWLLQADFMFSFDVGAIRTPYYARSMARAAFGPNVSTFALLRWYAQKSGVLDPAPSFSRHQCASGADRDVPLANYDSFPNTVRATLHWDILNLFFNCAYLVNILLHILVASRPTTL
jgi:hypothetical protein